MEDKDNVKTEEENRYRMCPLLLAANVGLSRPVECRRQECQWWTAGVSAATGSVHMDCAAVVMARSVADEAREAHTARHHVRG